MNAVAIQCPDCSHAEEVPAPVLLVVLTPVTDGADGCSATVHWICAGCAELVAIPVGRVALPTLVSAGAGVVQADTSDPRPPHPETAVDGPAFSPDDLLEFHQRLSGVWTCAAMFASWTG